MRTIVRSVPATRAELAEKLGLRGQAVPHLLARAAMEGRVAMTPDRVFVPLELPRRPTATARWTSSRAATTPATPARRRDDLAYWSGLPKRDCRPAPDAASDDGPVPRVQLPPFDELLLGWRDRSVTVPPRFAKHVHPGGGIIRACVIEDGVVVGRLTAGR